MAVVSVQARFDQEYNIAEQALQDRLAQVYGGDENAVDLFRFVFKLLTGKIKITTHKKFENK